MGSAEHKRCLGCGYILDGLPENRCPECGRSFDPCDPTTYLTKRESGRFYLIIAIVAASAMGLIGICILLAVIDLWPRVRVPKVLAVGLSYGSAIANLYVIIYGVTALRRPPGTVSQRRLLIVAILIAGLSLCAFWILMGFGRVGSGRHYFSCWPLYHEW